MLEIGIMNKHNISKLADILEKDKSVEFKYNNLFYEIFQSCDTGNIVNLYSSDEKDEDGEYLEENLVDGGLCTGRANLDAKVQYKEEHRMKKQPTFQ